MRVDVEAALSEVQVRIAERRAALVCISGPPGSGKTTALAARAIAAAGAGRDGDVLVICPNASSCDAFEAAIARTAQPAKRIRVDTLAGHLAQALRRDWASAGASPELIIGTAADSRSLAARAAASFLDMSWPGFRSPGFTLDLPFLTRPDAFIEEAAALFRLLRRWNVSPDAFESACAFGVHAFYGDDVERARALTADPSVRGRASRRGREALSADARRLRVQKKAERDLGTLLAAFYRAYVAAARGAAVLGAEDVVDEALTWLQRDPAAVARFAAGVSAVLVDDAEDAEPATRAVIDLLARAGVAEIAAASSAASAIDGIGGRRPLILGDDAQQVDLSAAAPVAAQRAAVRFKDEREEADWVAAEIRTLLANGVAPGDVAVLARDDAAVDVYARLLGERGVPIAAPPTAWQSPHDVADILALACVVDDPYDHAHLLRVLASPLVGLSDHSLLTLCRAPDDAAQLSFDVMADEPRGPAARGSTQTTLAENALYGHADLLLSASGRASLLQFRERWAVWRARVAQLAPPQALAYLMEAAGFRAAWHGAPAFLRPRLAADAERLLTAAARLPSASLGATARALEEGHGCIDPAGDAPDTVVSRTILGSKGMRRPYVFVAGVAHERFPRVYVSRAMAFSKRYGLVVRENVAGGAAQSAKFAWYYANFGAKRMYLEEERRALEYALTRADVQATASGFGSPPRWAADHDLLAALGV